MSLPRKTFARKIINMRGYTTDEEVTEVANIDGVSREEAARRIAVAKAQRTNRSVAQYVRHCKAKDELEEAQRRVLTIAHTRGRFLCANELEHIARLADWKAPMGSFSLWDTGRVFVEICRPLEKTGLLDELRDDDERFIGYTITDSGRQALFSDAPLPVLGTPG